MGIIQLMPELITISKNIFFVQYPLSVKKIKANENTVPIKTVLDWVKNKTVNKSKNSTKYFLLFVNIKLKKLNKIK